MRGQASQVCQIVSSLKDSIYEFLCTVRPSSSSYHLGNPFLDPFSMIVSHVLSIPLPAYNILWGDVHGLL